MNEMVERVAQALWHQRVARLQIPWKDNATESDKRYCREAARAAIAAMREPTEAMMRESDTSLSAWQAAIDAALAD